MAKKKKKELDLTGKFVVAFDTMLDGWNCVMTEDDDGNSIPCLFDSEDEAFKEMFDGNLSMLESRSAKELKEYNEGATKKLVKQMREVFDSGDIKKMRKFWDKHQDWCNDNQDWVEPAETYLQGRKLIFGKNGFQIIGEPIK